MRFDNKAVIITGGTAGIGLATAQHFGELGAKVAICGTNENKLNNAIAHLQQKNVQCWGSVCDISKAASLTDFVDKAIQHMGGLDIWINNAGIYPQYRIIDTPEDVWDRVFDINVKAIYRSAKIVKERMNKGGVLLNASSFAALMPSVGSGVYAATKSAVTSLTKTLAAELAPYQIRVNAYIPGLIRTDMTNAVIETNEEGMTEVIALQRIGEPDDVAASIAFLASEGAKYITGAVLEISGGKYCVQNPKAAWTLFDKEIQTP